MRVPLGTKNSVGPDPTNPEVSKISFTKLLPPPQQVFIQHTSSH